MTDQSPISTDRWPFYRFTAAVTLAATAAIAVLVPVFSGQSGAKKRADSTSVSAISDASVEEVAPMTTDVEHVHGDSTVQPKYAEQWPDWRPHQIGEYRYQFLDGDTHIEVHWQTPTNFKEHAPFIQFYGSKEKHYLVETEPGKWCVELPGMRNPITWFLDDSSVWYAVSSYAANTQAPMPRESGLVLNLADNSADSTVRYL